MDLWDVCNKIELALLNSVAELRAAIGGLPLKCGMIIWTIVLPEWFISSQDMRW